MEEDSPTGERAVPDGGDVVDTDDERVRDLVREDDPTERERTTIGSAATEKSVETTAWNMDTGQGGPDDGEKRRSADRSDDGLDLESALSDAFEEDDGDDEVVEQTGDDRHRAVGESDPDVLFEEFDEDDPQDLIDAVDGDEPDPEPDEETVDAVSGLFEDLSGVETEASASDVDGGAAASPGAETDLFEDGEPSPEETADEVEGLLDDLSTVDVDETETETPATAHTQSTVLDPEDTGFQWLGDDIQIFPSDGDPDAVFDAFEEDSPEELITAADVDGVSATALFENVADGGVDHRGGASPAPDEGWSADDADPAAVDATAMFDDMSTDEGSTAAGDTDDGLWSDSDPADGDGVTTFGGDAGRDDAAEASGDGLDLDVGTSTAGAGTESADDERDPSVNAASGGEVESEQPDDGLDLESTATAAETETDDDGLDLDLDLDDADEDTGADESGDDGLDLDLDLDDADEDAGTDESGDDGLDLDLESAATAAETETDDDGLDLDLDLDDSGTGAGAGASTSQGETAETVDGEAGFDFEETSETPSTGERSGQGRSGAASEPSSASASASSQRGAVEAETDVDAVFERFEEDAPEQIIEEAEPGARAGDDVTAEDERLEQLLGDLSAVSLTPVETDERHQETARAPEPGSEEAVEAIEGLLGNMSASDVPAQMTEDDETERASPADESSPTFSAAEERAETDAEPDLGVAEDGADPDGLEQTGEDTHVAVGDSEIDAFFERFSEDSPEEIAESARVPPLEELSERDPEQVRADIGDDGRTPEVGDEDPVEVIGPEGERRSDEAGDESLSGAIREDLGAGGDRSDSRRDRRESERGELGDLDPDDIFQDAADAGSQSSTRRDRPDDGRDRRRQEPEPGHERDADPGRREQTRGQDPQQRRDQPTDRKAATGGEDIVSDARRADDDAAATNSERVSEALAGEGQSESDAAAGGRGQANQAADADADADSGAESESESSGVVGRLLTRVRSLF